MHLQGVHFSLCLAWILLGTGTNLTAWSEEAHGEKALPLRIFYAEQCQKQNRFQVRRSLLPEHERKGWNRHKEKRFLTDPIRNGFPFSAVMRLTVPLFPKDGQENVEGSYDR